MNNVLIHHSIKIFRGVLKILVVFMILRFQVSIYRDKFKLFRIKVLELLIGHLIALLKIKNLISVKNKKNLLSIKILNFWIRWKRIVRRKNGKES